MTPILSTASLLFLTTIAVTAQDPLRQKQPLGDGSTRELQLYEIGDLVANITSKPEDTEVDRQEYTSAVRESLRHAIETYVQPPLDEGEEVKTLGASHLVAVARPTQHAWVRAFLALQADTAGAMAMLEAHVLAFDPALYEALAPGDEPSVVDRKRFAELEKKILAAESGVDVLTAPRLVAFAHQQFTVSIIDQVAYVKDFDVEVVEPGHREIADPVIDVVQDGVVFDGTWLPMADGGVGLACHLNLTDLERPIRTAKLKIGTNQSEVEIALPVVHQVEIDATVLLPKDGVALFPAPELDGKRILLVMTARQWREGETPDAGKGLLRRDR